MSWNPLSLPADQLLLVALSVGLAALIRAFTGFGFAMLVVPAFSLFLSPGDAVVLSAVLALLLGLMSYRSWWGLFPVAPAKFMLIGAVLGTAIGVWFLASLSVTEFQLWIGVLVFCLFGGVMFLAARHDRNTPRRLLITPQEIRAEDAAAQNYGHRIGRSSLRLDDIEEVHTESSGMMHRVMISSDKGEMRVGNGISADAADWLSQFIISAIANADTAQPREPA